MLREEQDGRALLIPLLRSLGNLAAGGGAHAADQLLGLDAAPALEALVVCAGVSGAVLRGCAARRGTPGRRFCTPGEAAPGDMQQGDLRTARAVRCSARSQTCLRLDMRAASPGVRHTHTHFSSFVPVPQTHHHGLQKEACWVISNVAGMPGRRGLEAVKAAGAVPVGGLQPSRVWTVHATYDLQQCTRRACTCVVSRTHTVLAAKRCSTAHAPQASLLLRPVCFHAHLVLFTFYPATRLRRPLPCSVLLTTHLRHPLPCPAPPSPCARLSS